MHFLILNDIFFRHRAAGMKITWFSQNFVHLAKFGQNYGFYANFIGKIGVFVIDLWFQNFGFFYMTVWGDSMPNLMQIKGSFAPFLLLQGVTPIKTGTTWSYGQSLTIIKRLCWGSHHLLSLFIPKIAFFWVFSMSCILDVLNQCTIRANEKIKTIF